MEILKNLKDDLHHVFIDGDAKNQQLSRVFMLLDFPLLCALVALSLIIK